MSHKQGKGQIYVLEYLKAGYQTEKTMNVILLLFTILAAVFVASGLNNVVTVMNGTDYFLKKPGSKIMCCSRRTGMAA